MKIINAKFVTSFADCGKYLEFSAINPLSEVCVVGRSNVGKSTFINMMASRTKLAKTSSTPGRTRLVNLFDFDCDNAQFRLVDLPGYGYAQASKSTRQDWGELIEGYLLRSNQLKHTFVLVDSRHEPTALDVAMTEYLYYYRMPFTVIATKCDKISKAERARNIQAIATKLKIGRDNIIPVAITGDGRDRVCAKIEEIINSTNN